MNKAMRKIQRMMVAVTAVALSTLYSVSGFAIVCENCSDSFQQALMLAQSTAQLGQMVIQTEQAIKQTEMQLKNLERLGEDLLKNPVGWLKRLANLTGQLNTYRGEYNAILQVMNELYPDQEFLSELAGVTGESREEANKRYQEHYDEWSKKINDASFATFQLSARQLKDMAESEEFDEYIENLLSKPEGHMQVMEAANSLAAVQIQEIRELREMITTQSQHQIMQEMKQEKEDEYRVESIKTIFDSSGAKVNPNHKQELNPGYNK